MCGKAREQEQSVSGWAASLGHLGRSGVLARGVPLRYLANHLRADEVPGVYPERHAEGEELVDLHLPFPVEDAPKPLAVGTDAPGELGDGDAALPAHKIDLFSGIHSSRSSVTCALSARLS